ncbi:hypothetical protein E6Q11_00475 [Candidatus Dojkabacteria bacterium]|uniref:Uncharacterized protein n=1 Tax=Candidatus Dojkabacteria bacterium TaxID=2099670 RepID=A0A5C7JDR6_9BACT|nr:MAG: hypothetical protein E6Q11_00475 [Candidatus Dojkabacteria bacterium]
MKHGILAHQIINTSATNEAITLYTFAAPAVYRLFYENGGLDAYINGLPLVMPLDKHLANAGDVITVKGVCTALLEGIEQ